MTQMTSEGRTFQAPAETTPQASIPAGYIKAFKVPGNPPFLREKNGQVWPYSEGMAARGDLVTAAYDISGSPNPPSDHPDYGVVASIEVIDAPVRRTPPRKPQRVTDVVASMQE